MNSPRPLNSLRASHEEEIAHSTSHHFPHVHRRLAEEKARILWNDLARRYALPAEQEARFISDKTADFLRTVTNKDRRDITAAIARDLRRREEGRPAFCPNTRTAAIWTNRWAILISGLNMPMA